LKKQADNPKSSGVVERPSPESRPSQGCVLVVDDDMDYRRIVGLRMESVGGKCHVSGTHEEALRLLSRHPEIDVAVLDYHMRGENVAMLVRQVQELRPEVMLIGHSSMERREHFAALGVDRFLLKPWSPSDLFAVLSDHPP